LDSPILTAAQMRAVEKAAFDRGATAETLMDQAGAGIARTIMRFFPKPGRCVVFAGKGNNAGDALVAAEHLSHAGWKIETRLSFEEADCGDLMRKKLAALGKIESGRGLSAPNPSRTGIVAALRPLPHSIILDGLLGLGAKPPLRDPIRRACREINQLRRQGNAYVCAVDLPTGLDGESGKPDRDCVVADFTITVGFAKRGLVADRATNFVGRLEVVSLKDFRRDKLRRVLGRASASPSEILATASSLRSLLPRRAYDAYKNQFGRIGIVAGSKGFSGAAIMCSLGALRAGAGLVEVFVPEDIYEVVASAAPAEAMVKPVLSYRDLLSGDVDVWGIGPGLGQDHADEILQLIQSAERPMVVDADALNILSGKTVLLNRCKGPRLLTPHPGEMKRLFGPRKETRVQTAQRFTTRFPVTLLLKGSRTIVAQRRCPLSFNATGNPGMATGGMGDVLTGVCSALIAQKLSLYDAARLGAWLCGRAAEIAIFEHGESEESLLPRDVLGHLGEAFNDLKNSIA
jgi:ADP-dependent NAD(P)H-hydrate dehydratase / NAD(P)H-hydrate epimerase